MTKKKKIILFVCTFFIVFILSSIIDQARSPHKRSINMFRSYILHATPLGTHIHDAINILNNNENFENININFQSGFNANSWEIRNGVPVGDMFIRVGFEFYRVWYRWFPLMEWSTSAFWIFDEGGYLIEVHIRRHGMI